MSFLEDGDGFADVLPFDDSFGQDTSENKSEEQDWSTTEAQHDSFDSNCHERFLNPILLNLRFTKGTCFPSYLVLIISSVLILYIVFKKYRAVINVYFSVLFYIFCQIQFLVVTTISWITESSKVDTSLTDNQIRERCQTKMPFQTFSIILPGYAVLMITLVRTIFVSRPLSYFDYIRRRYQLFGAGLSVILCGLISVLPRMGAFCDIQVTTYLLCDTFESFRYCAHRGKTCSLYFTVLVGIGSVLPIVLISCLYIYIYKITVTARKAHEVLTRRNLLTQQRSCEDVLEVKRGNGRISKERRSVPWSILALLGVFVASSTPWILLQVMKDEITDVLMKEQAGSQTFDLAYSLVQLFVGFSTLIYLLTTTSLRTASFRLIKKIPPINTMIRH